MNTAGFDPEFQKTKCQNNVSNKEAVFPSNKEGNQIMEEDKIYKLDEIGNNAS